MAQAERPSDAGRRPIELRVREIGQLFHTLDPLPFRERDLDVDVEDYVVGWARELPRSGPIEIVVHLPRAELEHEHAPHVADAIRNYFSYRASAISRDLTELFRIGRLSLLIGLAVLAICVITAELVGRALEARYFGRFFNEGLVILGSVANWRPIEIFLYEWWPLTRRRSLYLRLANATVTLMPAEPDAARTSPRPGP